MTTPSTRSAELVDNAGRTPLLVVGSVPPEARDLDLLVPDDEVPVLERALEAAGFEGAEGEWVRFDGGRVLGVDVIPASSLGLPADEATRLFADGEPIAGYERLRRPAAPDALLLLARRQLGVRARLAEKHARRIKAILAREKDAWAVAAERAPAWGARHALKVLRDAWRGGRAPVARRALAAAEAAGREGAPAAGRARAAASVLRAPPGRGAVIALSGMDGSGKSTQAAVLAEALEDLGHDAAVEWSRITYDPGLNVIAAPVKLVLARLERRRGAPPPPPPDGPDEDAPRPGDVTARGIRERIPAINHAWVIVVALVHAVGQRRTLRPHMRQGRVVVRDRYVLDATVQLEDVYGDGRAAGLPGRVLRLICPRPAAAFWLDVDPQTAYDRKPEEYTASQLGLHRPRYAALHEQLGVVRVDGARDPDAVSADLAREAWRRLR